MSDTTAPISRRQFCGACMASCATLATLATACGGEGSPTGPSGGSAADLNVIRGQFANARVQVNTAGTPLANVGGAARVESNAGLFLVSRTSDTTFTVIDGVCTHEGCTITGATATQYVCPCHGSRYNLTGQVQQGPAKAKPSAVRQHLRGRRGDDRGLTRDTAWLDSIQKSIICFAAPDSASAPPKSTPTRTCRSRRRSRISWTTKAVPTMSMRASDGPITRR